MFAFELGREFKLSIAEILKVFPKGNALFCDKKILILDNITQEEILGNAKKLGGSIKIMSVQEVSGEVEEILEQNMGIDAHEGKFNYAMNIFGNSRIGHKELLKISKKIIKEHGKNPRFINQDFKNISSVAIIKEALVKKATDFNFIFTPQKNYFGTTIFVQDIYGYSNRDYGKDRDMHIGMLPPKLAQMMINISGGTTIYDPFVGLGTVLIESIYMGNTKVFGSDINERMVQTSQNNLQSLRKYFTFQDRIVFQNAKYISEIEFFNEVDAIVSEGYLGEIMTQNNISIERIEKQRQRLSDLYEGFFSGLTKGNFTGTIVISFPFWEIKGKYFYFEEIYDTIRKYCKVKSLLPDDLEFQATKSGSLLYKRDAQLVGREIFCLELK